MERSFSAREKKNVTAEVQTPHLCKNREGGPPAAIFFESEMALFSECMRQCARKLLDTADIVRDAIYHQ